MTWLWAALGWLSGWWLLWRLQAQGLQRAEGTRHGETPLQGAAIGQGRQPAKLGAEEEGRCVKSGMRSSEGILASGAGMRREQACSLADPEAADVEPDYFKTGHPQLPTISVIVPVRNEAANIRRLLASLAAQTAPPLEVIVVDDGSTDGTGAIAADVGARVVEPGELPTGWFGKSWACWNGANTASGQLLVFLDADITVLPTGLELLAACYLQDGLVSAKETVHRDDKHKRPMIQTGPSDGLLSVQPYHVMERLYEQLSAYMNVIVLVSVAGKDNKSGAFGPCIVCSQEGYFSAGGHEPVRQRVLEHHALGQHMAGLGRRISNRPGRGILSFRMYPEGLRSLLAGWSKSFASGASATPLIRLTAVSLWIAGSVSAFLMLVQAAIELPDTLTMLQIGAASAVYLAYAIQTNKLFRSVGQFSVCTALLFPLPLLAFLLLFIWSGLQTFVRRQVSWKGRALTTSKERRVE